MGPINTCLVPVIFVLALEPTTVWADNPPTADRLEKLVRDFAFSSNPKLNPYTQFNIRKFDVNGLSEGLRIAVFDVEYVHRGQKFNGFVGMYHDGKITRLAPTFGGYGLMSGVMHKGEFYCTYSWGSGIHRSHIAKLHLQNGKLKQCGSGGFPDKDLFVSAGSDGKLHVFSASYKDFNRWETGKDIGTVAETNSVLRIVTPNGEILAPTFPHQEQKPGGALPPRSETN